MSGKAIGWAFDQTGLSKPAKFLLVAIADHAWHDGTNAHPGITLLATKTCDSERNVKRIVKELQTTGHLIREAPGGGRGRKTGWRLPLEKGDILGNSSTTQPSPPPSVVDPETVTPRVTNGDMAGNETVTPRAVNGDMPRDIEPIEPSEGTEQEPWAPSATNTLPDVPRETLPAPVHTDPVKITLVTIFGEVDPDNPDDTWPLRQRLINKARATSQADPAAEIARRAETLLAQWGPGALTVPSLIKHWSRLGAMAGQLTRADADHFADGQQRARRHAEIAAAFDRPSYPANRPANQEPA